MRQRFEQQMNLRTVAIADVKFPLKSRDEVPPVLKALQYIFITPELNEKVFHLLEQKICKDKKPTGRKGMDLWHILVLAVLRHTLNTNWDRLEHLANYDQLIRAVMGVHATAFIEEEKIEFNYQTILDNVHLIDEELLQQINQLVVEAGHSLVKKKEQEEALRLKTDSYVLETNVHFPTDLNLLWDSSRKCLDMIEALRKEIKLPGWRKIKHIRKTIKSIFRAASWQVFKGKKEEHKKQSVKIYLQQTTALVHRCQIILEQSASLIVSPNAMLALVDLRRYVNYAIKMIDLTHRRLINDEVIPASEKIYSIFEPHTEWITKGKLNKRTELGHLLLITTDQYQFIVDYKVMEGQKDPSQIPSLIERIQQRFKDQIIYSHSFDKGFYSKDNLSRLLQSGIAEVIMPKKGKLNEEEKQRESAPQFKSLRHAHSAVESNINMLEHHGLNRCTDKGLPGYKRCVGLSVLAYNLHLLGNSLTEQEKNRDLKKQRSRFRQAA